MARPLGGDCGLRPEEAIQADLAGEHAEARGANHLPVREPGAKQGAPAGAGIRFAASRKGWRDAEGGPRNAGDSPLQEVASIAFLVLPGPAKRSGEPVKAACA